ncbi:hypothetical protein ATANTOWER_020471 [Ataeniobius toweri]|uniref:Uncharacterized protein n=1 Tax=Ataeniobius toweri TaxID=208326 RepID=A0ABU7CI98_9TELE|nr:hypothetical protein [Ataeniobius toweri]
MPLVGSPMANRLWVTGQTKSGSRRLHEDHKKLRHMMLPGMAEPGSHPGARPGVRTHRRAPGYSSQDLAGPSTNECREAIPQWAHHLQGEPRGAGAKRIEQRREGGIPRWPDLRMLRLASRWGERSLRLCGRSRDID